MLSDLSPTDKEREVYETIEADPPLKPEGPVQPQPLLAPAGDYKFTKCPAYVLMATTSIHGNTNKPADTPS